MGRPVTLRGEYDIARREELRAKLRDVDLSGDVTIDMSEVTLLDAGSAALLILLQRRLQDQTPGARVILTNTAPIVRRLIDLCGATALFVFVPDG